MSTEERGAFRTLFCLYPAYIIRNGFSESGAFFALLWFVLCLFVWALS